MDGTLWDVKTFIAIARKVPATECTPVPFVEKCLLINVFFSISIKSPDAAALNLFFFFFFVGLHWFPLLRGNSKSHNSLKIEM